MTDEDILIGAAIRGVYECAKARLALIPDSQGQRNYMQTVDAVVQAIGRASAPLQTFSDRLGVQYIASGGPLE